MGVLGWLRGRLSQAGRGGSTGEDPSAAEAHPEPPADDPRGHSTFVLTKVGEEGLTDDQIASIFAELGIEPAPEDDGDSGEVTAP